MKMNVAEIEAIRRMKATKTSQTMVGTYKFKLQCSPRKEKEYKLLSFDASNPYGDVNTSYISWEDFNKI